MTVVSTMYYRPPLPQCLGKYRVNLQSINVINAFSSICVSPASRSLKLTNTSLFLLYRSPLLPPFHTHFYCSPPTSLPPPISPSSLLRYCGWLWADTVQHRGRRCVSGGLCHHLPATIRRGSANLHPHLQHHWLHCRYSYYHLFWEGFSLNHSHNITKTMFQTNKLLQNCNCNGNISMLYTRRKVLVGITPTGVLSSPLVYIQRLQRTTSLPVGLWPLRLGTPDSATQSR